MLKQKVFVVVSDNYELDIVLEDGGIASIHHNGEHFLTSYYQDRPTIEQYKNNTMFDADSPMNDSKMYLNDWDEGIDMINLDMIYDAAEWLDTSFNRNFCEIVYSNYAEIVPYLEAYAKHVERIEAKDEKLMDAHKKSIVEIPKKIETESKKLLKPMEISEEFEIVKTILELEIEFKKISHEILLMVNSDE